MVMETNILENYQGGDIIINSTYVRELFGNGFYECVHKVFLHSASDKSL